MHLVSPYIKLIRPANIVTAFADVLAGAAIVSGGFSIFSNPDLILLLLGTAGLYGGGVVFNDYFDAELDKIERPERPIPSGRVPKKNAFILGALLFSLGIIASFLANLAAGIVAFFISFFAVLYDAKAKHIDFVGPAIMGLCRGMNLFLGMSIMPSLLTKSWYLLFIPIVYIAAITSVSKGEVHGSGRQPLFLAGFFYLFVFTTILVLGILNGKFVETLPFLLLFLVFVFPKLITAIKDPSAGKIGLAVKAGIISLIVMNASLAAAFSGVYFGIIILILLPLSILIAKSFAVT